jgi:hypothetical protein
MFAQAATGQQQVLETNSAQERFDYIIKTLDDTVKHTSAALALESVFSPTARSEEESKEAKEGSDSESSA